MCLKKIKEAGHYFYISLAATGCLILVDQLKYPLVVFTLKASLETCITRNNMRKKPLDEQEVKNVFDLVSAFDYGYIIDTTRYTVNDITTKIRGLCNHF